MTEPIDLLNNYLLDIAKNIKEAHNNNAPKEDIKKMIDIYNSYYCTIQLVGSHLEIPYFYTRLIMQNDNKIIYKPEEFKLHLRGLRRKKFNYERFNKEIRREFS